MDKRVLVPGTLEPYAHGVELLLAKRGFAAVFCGRITADDIDCGLAHVDNDVCVATIASVGQYLRYFDAHGAAGISVLAPELCRECRCISVAATMRCALGRAGYGNVDIVPFSCAEVASSIPARTDSTVAADEAVIGVCGTMPVLSTAQFHDVVVSHLEQAGCRVLMPPAQLIADERDFLTPALRYFDACGVKSVICILPFGCLGGHAFGRGQLRTMQRAFPDIELTMLDYDPSASDINLVNRTELVIQSAQERAAACA